VFVVRQLGRDRRQQRGFAADLERRSSGFLADSASTLMAAHRHIYTEIDQTPFAAAYAQPGVKVCRKCGTPKIGSSAEENLAALLRLEKLDHGMQREFTFWPGRKFRFDFAWPTAMTAVEVEGGSFSGGHKRGAAYESDCEKANEAAIRGWSVYRVTPAMVNDGRAVALLKRAWGISR